MKTADLEFMRRALELASEGEGLVSPNPMVGAVIVTDGKIAGEGYHRFHLLRHAESYAIEQAGNLSRGATLYCNLEPCCHYGRTPPCTDALIGAGISRAVIAVSDPDPRVSGMGIDRLRAAGVDVEVGLCEAEARRLNETYFKYMSTGQPFIHSVLIEENTKDRVLASRQIESDPSDWVPSVNLLTTAANYDALVFGGLDKINRAFLQSFLERDRHRSPVVLGSSEQIGGARAIIGKMGGRDVSLVIIERTEASQKLLDDLSRLKVVSVFVLPPPAGGSDFWLHPDKVTMVRRTSLRKNATAESNQFSTGLQNPHITQAHGFTEITGYPNNRGESTGDQAQE